METGVVLIRLTGWPAVPLRTFNNENFGSGKFIEMIHYFISSFSLGKSLPCFAVNDTSNSFCVA